MTEFLTMQNLEASLNIQVNNPQFKSEFFTLSEHLFLTKRQQSFQNVSTIVDTFGQSWILICGKFPEGKVFLKKNNQWIPVTQNQYLYIPPFSLVEWKVLPCEISWVGITSDKALDYSPNTARLLDRQNEVLPSSRHSIEELINEKSFVDVEKNQDATHISQQLKKMIDTQFRNPLKLNEFTSQMKASYDYIFKSFKTDFGISPLDYLRRLRFFYSMDLIMYHGQEVFESAINSGLNTPSQIYRLYIELAHSNPSQFLWSKSRVIPKPKLIFSDLIP